MKNTLVKGLLAFCILFIFACNSNKYMENEVYYILDLNNEKAAKLLDMTYKDYQISNVKRISKSKYQFSASFVCIEENCQALETQLKSDGSVIRYQLRDKEIVPVSTTKGSKASRTGPVGSKGGQ